VRSARPKIPAGYNIDDDAPVVGIPEFETRSTAVEERIVVDSPQVVLASLQAKPHVPISSPVSDDAPQAFSTTAPTSDAPSIHSYPECSVVPAHGQDASVTFGA
ncbi:uncharacterized protein BJ212DRAFT_1369932, partial [Suillus subaureus]